MCTLYRIFYRKFRRMSRRTLMKNWTTR